MPNCVALIRIGETKPTSFQAIDEELCKHLNKPCDPKYWLNGWYNVIAFGLALGWDYDKIEANIQAYLEKDKAEGDAEMVASDELQLEICKYLKANFKADTWVEIGKRG